MANADAFFSIGKAHRVCEDYAIAGADFAVVSDGCSGSVNTDVGARFMAIGLANTIGIHHCDFSRWQIYSVCARADSVRALLKLPEPCLDCTLLAVRSYARQIRAVAWGDGVIAARRRDGKISVIEIEFDAGAPAYPSYLLNDSRAAAYLAFSFAARRSVTLTTETDSGLVIEKTEMFGLEGYYVDFETEDYDLVAVMSDGAQDFKHVVEGVLEPVPTFEICKLVLAVQNTKGAFIERRCRNFLLRRHCVQQGWFHEDDFSVGAVACE